MNWALSLLSAALLILIFPRFDLVWLAPVALAPLLIATAREQRPLRRFLMGWTAGIVYWFGVCYWIEFVLAVYGGMGDVEGWAVFMLFALAKGLHIAIFALVAGILMRRWWAAPAVAALWVAVEVTHGPMGFAWLALGNAGIAMRLPMRLAPFAGVYGLSFAFALMAAVLAVAILRRPRRELAWLALLAPVLLLPSLPDAERGRDSALLVQPNIPVAADWTAESLDRAERRQVTDTLRGVLEQTGGVQAPSIVAWPEDPGPFYYFEDPHFRAYADNVARTAHVWLLAGIVAHAPDGAPLNSAVLVSPEGQPVSRYDKVNLVPFGEFVPAPFRWLTQKISQEAGDFEAGRRVVVSPVGSHRLGTFICYESVFPNFVRKFADGGAEVLFNLSNDGWFGNSSARRQHLSIVRMRAAENRRWILRATNDGITATIDSAGRLRGTLPLYTEATSYTGFTYIADRTIYTRFGDWFPALCAALALLCLAAERANR